MSATYRCLLPLLAVCAFASEQSWPSASALRVRQTAISNLKLRILTSPQSVRTAIDAVPAIANTTVQPTVTAPTAPAVISVATPQQKATLVDNLNKFIERTTNSQRRYSALATAFVISSFILALTVSLLGFTGKTRLAGICGVVLTAITGLPSVYPVNALASFNRTLAAQSSAILLDCSLQEPMPVDSYNSASNQLKALLVYEGTNYPQFGNTTDSTKELVNQLQMLKVSNVALQTK